MPLDIKNNELLLGGKSPVKCPALLLSAPASNQGKTMVTAALAYHHRKQGRRVKVFKTGPDFLDPMILEQASGQPVDPLDLWMVGESGCAKLLFEAAQKYDVLLVEGVMGLNDGKPSTADLARRFRLPVVMVMDITGMAETSAALASGLISYNADLQVLGFLANNAGSERHAAVVATALKEHYLGALMRDPRLEIPRRHLGLAQASEIDKLESRFQTMAESLQTTPLAALPEAVEFLPPELSSCRSTNTPAPSSPSQTIGNLLQGRRIGVARDSAFSFIYSANLRLLEEMGADLSYFSPVHDTVCPATDAIYLPGGYPELYLKDLGNNFTMREAFHKHHKRGGIIYAECGGMLYLLDSLTDKEGNSGTMLGLLKGSARLQARLSALGHQYFHTAYGALRGHTFHYSSMTGAEEVLSQARKKLEGNPGESLLVNAQANIAASYMHAYFPSNPRAVAGIFNGEIKQVFSQPQS